MISPEAQVFNDIATDLLAQYPGISISQEASDTQARFPAVTIVEMDNSVLQKMSTTNIENAVMLMYEVNVFSNLAKQSERKKQCKEIIAVIDGEFARLGFTRTMCNPIANLQDNKIYRMISRYTGVCDRNFRIYTK